MKFKKISDTECLIGEDYTGLSKLVLKKCVDRNTSLTVFVEAINESDTPVGDVLRRRSGPIKLLRLHDKICKYAHGDREIPRGHRVYSDRGKKFVKRLIDQSVPRIVFVELTKATSWSVNKYIRTDKKVAPVTLSTIEAFISGDIFFTVKKLDDGVVLSINQK